MVLFIRALKPGRSVALTCTSSFGTAVCRNVGVDLGLRTSGCFFEGGRPATTSTSFNSGVSFLGGSGGRDLSFMCTGSGGTMFRVRGVSIDALPVEALLVARVCIVGADAAGLGTLSADVADCPRTNLSVDCS